MITAKGWEVSLLLLVVVCVFGQGAQKETSVPSRAGKKLQNEKRHIQVWKKNSTEPWEWTTWYNVDHPGGNGDYERLDAIRFYYRDKVCQAPIRIEARTTDWVPAERTGEVVHTSLTRGFWCINKEQQPGRKCSNYSVRFLCPKNLATAAPTVIWSPWSKWSQCPMKCGDTGLQTRTRTCLLESHPGAHCDGPSVEGRICERISCIAACNLTCPMGHVSSDCDACRCEEHLLHGAVYLPHGAPAARATVYLKTHTLRPVTESDGQGQFRIHGVCPDGQTILIIKKEKYSSISITVPKSSNQTLSVRASFRREEKPYVVENPEHKARREGQSVTFCCSAVGEPTPHQYLWYHNGTLLDQTAHRYNSNLALRNLRMNQAGDYYCLAISEAGSAKSQLAKLAIIENIAPSCEPKPESYLIRLPYDCFQNSTNSLYYDVGKCPSSTCAGEPEKGLRCKDSVAYCCGVSKMETRDIICQGYTLPTKVTMECGCQKCTETKIIVRGRASASDNGEPLRFGHVYLGKNRVSITGYKGAFSVQVPASTERLVLTFVDRMQRFVNTTKVLPFNKKGGAVFHEVKLLRKKAPITIDSSKTNQIPLGEVAGTEPIAELEFPPNTFYKQNGEVYTGKVKASVSFLDPRDMSTAAAAQSDLNFINDEGDTLPLRSYGMFSLDFTDEAATETLNAGAVKVFMDSTQVKMTEHLDKIKLWSLNPETGLWEEEGDFQFQSGKRGKREERTFLVGNMEIRERRLFNLDVPESRRCYVKIRAYRSERFLPSEQIEGVVINLINMEPQSGFSTNPRAWGRFDSTITGSNGACLPAFCDDQKADAYSAYVTATLGGGEELEAVASSPKFNPNAIGVPQPYLGKLSYRRTDHEDPKIKKTAFRINVAKPNPNAAEENTGPVYAFENARQCDEAPYSDAHFRFYRVEGDRYDYNTVPFNEDDPMSWTEDYLAWWPKPMEYRACYIKVKIIGSQEVNIRSRNMGGTHPQTVGKLYGIRDVRSIRDMDQPNLSTACLEFKCSGMLYDQDRVDRTLVKIVPQGSCKREQVNSMLHEYLVNHLPLPVNNDTNEYTMLGPLDPLGHNYGIYTVTDQDPRTAKEIALGRCFDGTSDGSSRVMKSNLGVALTFNCVEKEANPQSPFQQQQNVLVQAPVSPRRPRAGSNRPQSASFAVQSARTISAVRKAKKSESLPRD